MNAAAAKPDTKGHWTVCVIQPLDYKKSYGRFYFCVTQHWLPLWDHAYWNNAARLIKTPEVFDSQTLYRFFTDQDIEKWKELLNQSSENACDLNEKEAWQDLGSVIQRSKVI